MMKEKYLEYYNFYYNILQTHVVVHILVAGAVSNALAITSVCKRGKWHMEHDHRPNFNNWHDNWHVNSYYIGL